MLVISHLVNNINLYFSVLCGIPLPSEFRDVNGLVCMVWPLEFLGRM